MNKDLALVDHFIVFPAARAAQELTLEDKPGASLKPCPPEDRTTWAIAACFEDKTVTTIANKPGEKDLQAALDRLFEVYDEAKGRMRVMWRDADGRGCATPVANAAAVGDDLRNRGNADAFAGLIDALGMMPPVVDADAEIAPAL
jgi:hypothetical protein